MSRTKRSALPPISVGIARTRRKEIRPTPNGGWAWKCCLCDGYATLMDTAEHKLCHRHAALPEETLRVMLTAWHYQRSGRMPVPAATWGQTSANRVLST